MHKRYIGFQHLSSTFKKKRMGNTHTTEQKIDKMQPLLADEENIYSKNLLLFESIIYQANSFIAILWPVLITMFLSSYIACHITDAKTKSDMSSYLYYKNMESSTTPNSIKILESFTNGMIIILFIAIITFAVVILYKYNCMKSLIGYLIFSSGFLLMSVGSLMFRKCIESITNWPIDYISFYFIIYNFGIVGTLSIFYQKGISIYVEKGYLIITSVLMSWKLCQWPEWSVWTILLMLAGWDLFAVLSPCGPLHYLVKLISKEGRPMPGLLYEANVHATHIDPSSQIEIYKKKKNLKSSTISSTDSALSIQNNNKINESKEYSNVEILDTQDEREFHFFQEQLYAFYLDYNPSNCHQIPFIAKKYYKTPFIVWELIYDKYQVKHVPKNRIYPKLPLKENNNWNDLMTEKSTIKLGLGDFIFYSLLVSKAAMYDFTLFIICIIGILIGLGITMFLLVKFDALPALPIPIILGSLLYFLSYYFIIPMIERYRTNLLFF